VARNHERSELFELRSRDIVSELLAQLRRVRPALTLVQGDRECAAEIAPAPAGGSDLTLAALAPGFVHGAVAALRFRLHDAPFRVEGTLGRLETGRWRLGAVRVFSLDQRAAHRLALSGDDAVLRWSELADGDVRQGAATVDELGAEGIGFSVAPETLRSRDGSPFAATLEIDGRRIPCLAEPRYRRDTPTLTRVGVRLHTRAARGELVDAYLRRRFPQLLPRREAGAGDVVDLLDRSGYLALRPDMQPERRWFERSDDDDISRDVCFRAGDGALIGHVSFTRAYPRAWLGHQLATLRHHAEATACRRSIYLHIATYPTLVDGDQAMMVGYYDRARPWHQRFFSGFVEWLSAPELAVAYGLDRFERNTRAPAPMLPRTAAVDVHAPAGDELVQAAALVRGQLPPLIAEVLDIHPERLISSQLNGHYEATRYERGRHVLVLRERGEFVGVALCEIGSRELSIFNLFNMAQIFVATGRSRPSIAAQLQLLSAVRALYAARGEHNPMIVAPPGTVDAAMEPGTFLAETMGMIAWSGRALRQYENFINYQFGAQLSAIG
jgi:hypothetical protein